MRANNIAVVLGWAILGAAAAWAADSIAQTLFDRIHANVMANVKQFPRYTCVQTVTRSSFEMPPAGSSCVNVIASREKNLKSRVLRWHDRLRLDVAIGEKSEMFSWAGASRFESSDISDMIDRGASGSGEFGSFLLSVFGGDAQDFVYKGLRDTPLGRLAVFDYNVPLERSHYEYSSLKANLSRIGYRGSFLSDPDSGDLRELDISATEFPATDTVCRVNDVIQYARTKIGDSTFMLPSTSSMDVVYRNSTESLNEATYSGCREYVGESTISFNVDENGRTPEESKPVETAPLPPKVHLRVKISPPVDSRTAAAGDPITGVIENQVKEKNVVLVHAGDKLHGRIVRMEQTLGAAPRWTVAIVFETVERNGIEQSVKLKATDDGDRSPSPMRLGHSDRNVVNASDASDSPVASGSIAGRPAGGGIYSFPEPGNLVLGSKFESDWETR